MKRQTVLKILISCLNDDDIAIFAGSGICREAYNYDRVGNFYTSCDYMGAFAIGIAIGSKRRVFIFCEDEYFIKNLSEAAQMAVSRCKNLVYVVLRSGMYQDTGFQPTISADIGGLKNSMFNLGFLVHNYTDYMKMTNPKKEIRSIWKSIRGPLAVFVDITKGINRQVENIQIDYQSIKDRFLDFTWTIGAEK
jgi:hypothetical protein